MVSRNIILAVAVAVICAVFPTVSGFVPQSTVATSSRVIPELYVFGKKKAPVEDFSDIEVRDMTREEMLDMNKRNEEIMNMELSMMVRI